MNAQIAVLDYGSQYSQLIVRRVRELGYFAKLYKPEQLTTLENPSAVILSGGPRSVSDTDAPDVNFDYLRSLKVPILGVCYGMQLLTTKFGGVVSPSHTSEYGPAELFIEKEEALFAGIRNESQIWMSHSDTLSKLPEGCSILGRNKEGIPVALKWGEGLYGIQFHPEVTHSHEGTKILHNFLELAGVEPAFNIEGFKDDVIQKIQDDVAGRSVVCGVSGGVDSTVLAKLLIEAGVKVHCIYVDTGMQRKNETEEVVGNFKSIGIDIDVVRAEQPFLDALHGVAEPEKKRKIIGTLFLDVFFQQAGDIQLFAQGTLYPDVIESATSGSDASVIKTHHNRVDAVMKLKAEGKVIEPLAELFKDEVRDLGKALHIPHEILFRHPFPGPGLAVRSPGSITKERLDILREVDDIFIDELKTSGWYDKIWQAGAVLLSCKTVGVKGDERSYENPVSLRAVISEDAMTADWVEIPHHILRNISNRILNNVKGVNRVLYDISTKPPASIEWE